MTTRTSLSYSGVKVARFATAAALSIATVGWAADNWSAIMSALRFSYWTNHAGSLLFSVVAAWLLVFVDHNTAVRETEVQDLRRLIVPILVALVCGVVALLLALATPYAGHGGFSVLQGLVTAAMWLGAVGTAFAAFVFAATACGVTELAARLIPDRC